jgi:hypothetical protein
MNAYIRANNMPLRKDQSRGDPLGLARMRPPTHRRLERDPLSRFDLGRVRLLAEVRKVGPSLLVA